VDGLVVPAVCGIYQPWSDVDAGIPGACRNDSWGKSSYLSLTLILTLAAENVFVTGNMDTIGSWNPSKAIALSSADYPTWKGAVTVPANTKFQYRYQEPWVKLEFGSQTPIIKARLRPRGRVALSKTAGEK